MIKKEISHLCSDAFILVKSDISGFVWDKMCELKGKAPLLLPLLRECPRTCKQLLTSQSSIIGIVSAIMCMYNHASANLVQKMLSVWSTIQKNCKLLELHWEYLEVGYSYIQGLELQLCNIKSISNV